MNLMINMYIMIYNLYCTYRLLNFMAEIGAKK